MKDLNNYISKRHQNMVAKFNQDLQAWAKYTGEDEPTLYEDINTFFTLSNMRLENGCLLYNYDGREEREQIVQEEDGEFYETEGIDGIAEGIKFWRSCLRRAKRYWETDPDTLDKMSDGEIEDLD
jgi:hypothetical protein